MLKKVLIIDDDEISLFIARASVERCSFASEIITLTSAAKGLAYFETLESENDAPEIVFLDIDMPNINGWQFLNEFEKRYSSRFPNIYIVILSSTIDPRDLQRIEENNLVRDFMLKPLSPEALEKMYNEIKEGDH